MLLKELSATKLLSHTLLLFLVADFMADMHHSMGMSRKKLLIKAKPQTGSILHEVCGRR